MSSMKQNDEKHSPGKRDDYKRNDKKNGKYCNVKKGTIICSAVFHATVPIGSVMKHSD